MEWTRRNYQMGLAGFGYNWDEGDADTWTLIRRPEPVVWEDSAAKAEAGQAGLAGLHSGGSAGGFARGSYGATGGGAGLSLSGFGASGGGAGLGLDGALGAGGLGMASGDDVPPESLADEDSRFLYVHGIKVRKGLWGCPHRQGEGLGQMRQQGRLATLQWTAWVWACLSMPGSRRTAR